MTFKSRMLLSCLNIPKFSCLIHRSCGEEVFVWIKCNSYDLVLMTSECIKTLTCLSIPQLCCFIKRTCSHFVTIGDIKRHRINSISMPFKCMQQLSRLSLPYFTRSIITSCNKSFIW